MGLCYLVFKEWLHQAIIPHGWPWLTHRNCTPINRRMSFFQNPTFTWPTWPKIDHELAINSPWWFGVPNAGGGSAPWSSAVQAGEWWKVKLTTHLPFLGILSLPRYQQLLKAEVIDPEEQKLQEPAMVGWWCLGLKTKNLKAVEVVGWLFCSPVSLTQQKHFVG